MTMLKKAPKEYAGTVRDIVKDRVCVTLRPTDKLPDIIKKMHHQGGGTCGVTDRSGKFVGFITEREVIRKTFGNSLNVQERLDGLSEQKSAEDITAWDIMITNPNTLHPSDSVEDALEAITYFGYRYMPVVNNHGTLSGIVDARELHQHAYAKSRALLDSKDTLLSYFMNTEPYCAGVPV